MSRLLALIVVAGILFAAYIGMHDFTKGNNSGGSGGSGGPIAPVVVTAQMPNPLAGQ
ncbi:MAG TPA: hypothetical protein VGI06_07765 [Acidimicrobiales bacterium]